MSFYLIAVLAWFAGYLVGQSFGAWRERERGRIRSLASFGNGVAFGIDLCERPPFIDATSHLTGGSADLSRQFQVQAESDSAAVDALLRATRERHL